MGDKEVFIKHFSADTVVDLDNCFDENGVLHLPKQSEKTKEERNDLTFFLSEDEKKYDLQKIFLWAQTYSIYFVTRFEYKDFLQSCSKVTGFVMNNKQYLVVKF